MDIISYLTAPVPRWLAVVSVVSTGIASTGATYFILKDRLEKDYDKRLDAELEATKKFYSTIVKEDYPSPEDRVRELGIEEQTEEFVEIVTEYVPEDEKLTQVAKNVFTNYANMSTWDAEKEQAKREREPDMPYVISQEEFFENEPDNEQTQLVYYEEDGVLADTSDKPVDEAIVGPDNLERFGHGSNDPNIVYVRNEKMELDFEILRAEGKYADQVMGFSTLKHEDTHVRRFRNHDDE